MHELSIAQEILDIVKQSISDANPSSVKSVKISIGKLSNVLVDSLTFCYEAITSDTPLKDSQLEILEIPVKINCKECGKESEIEPPIFACPNCGKYRIKIISGTELQIDEIELFDEMVTFSTFQNKEKEGK
jgi:hydrogenase nickel incorporation protein HypA/HybF